MVSCGHPGPTEHPGPEVKAASRGSRILSRAGAQGNGRSVPHPQAPLRQSGSSPGSHPWTPPRGLKAPTTASVFPRPPLVGSLIDRHLPSGPCQFPGLRYASAGTPPQHPIPIISIFCLYSCSILGKSVLQLYQAPPVTEHIGTNHRRCRCFQSDVRSLRCSKMLQSR